MIITYLRSSSVGSFNWCQHKYFIEYVLGKRDVGGKKAEMGSTVHKVLEILAREKLALQNGQTEFFEEETKTHWKSPVVVEDALKVSFDYYESKSAHDWTDEDLRTCRNWVSNTLNYSDGLFDPRNRKIILPEQYFDLEIPYDWAKYEFQDPHDPSKTIRGRLQIKGTMDLITEVEDNLIEYVDWKGLPLDTLIPTPDGWTTMRKLEVGSQVFDKDGNITNVIGVSKIKEKYLYTITFNDGSEVSCDDEHLWTLHDGSVVSIKNLAVGNKISVAKAIKTEKKDLPIDPYILGVFLCGGINNKAEIKTKNEHILNEIKQRNENFLGFVTRLRNLNLISQNGVVNYSIPDIYLRASIEQRIDLLGAIMDCCGYNDINQGYCYILFEPQQNQYYQTFKCDIKELLLSLGIKHRHSLKKRYFQWRFKAPDFNLFYNSHDVETFEKMKSKDPLQLSSRHKFRTVKKIEFNCSELVQTKCIMVDSPTNTYLCTSNMIPTHNTGQRKNWETGKVKDHDDLTKDFQMRLYHYALCQLYPDKDIMMTIFFVRHGGPFTLPLDRSHIPETLEMIKNHFELIKKNKFPSRVLDYDKNSFKCRLLCGFYDGFCQQIRNELVELGINKVIAKHSKPGIWSNYGDGGGRSGENK